MALRQHGVPERWEWNCLHLLRKTPQVASFEKENDESSLLKSLRRRLTLCIGQVAPTLYAPEGIKSGPRRRSASGGALPQTNASLADHGIPRCRPQIRG